MNPSFDALVFSLLDGRITGPGHARLGEILRTNADARQRYLELVEIHALLAEDREEAASHGPAPVIPITELLRRQHRKNASRALLGAVAAIGIVAIVLKIVLVQDVPNDAAMLKASRHSIFTIQGPDPDSEPSPQEVLAPGSTLQLIQGTLSIDFASGVKSIIQAPASLSLPTPDRLFVHEGRAWFRVPEKAVGFQANTDQLHVTDLGTEFGIIADRGLRFSDDEVHVFKGKVEARTLHGLRKGEIITAGQARSAHLTGRLTAVPPASERFLMSLPDSLPDLHWPLDAPDPLQVGGSHPVSAEISTRTTGAAPRTVAGIAGQALEFSSLGGHLRTDWPGTDADRPRTISCWIKCPPHQPKGAIVEWGIPLITSAKWRLALNPEGRGEGGVRGALRTEFGNGYVIGTTDLRDGRWHHVVSVYDGSGRGSADSIRLYVNGKREPISASRENEIDTLVGEAGSSPCLIGALFEGTIDELRIFEGILPESAIDQSGGQDRRR